MQRDNVEHKVSLYADDALLFIPDPVQSLPPGLLLLSQFDFLRWLHDGLVTCPLLLSASRDKVQRPVTFYKNGSAVPYLNQPIVFFVSYDPFSPA